MLLAIATGVRTQLAATSAITTVVGTRIYYRLAAEGATLPYLVMADVGGGSTNDTPRDAFDVMWQVDAVAADGTTALQLADSVRSALHRAALTLSDPWRLLDIQHETPVFYDEEVERRQYYHAVQTFRIRGTQ